MAVGVDKRKYLRPETVALLNSMSLRARLVVEGYIIGHHRSPYHGFSVEFAEHRSYGPGDEIKHIDWKLFGKTDRLYVKRYEEETNLRAEHLKGDLKEQVDQNIQEHIKLMMTRLVETHLETSQIDRKQRIHTVNTRCRHLRMKNNKGWTHLFPK